jgi:glycosyltransferase involved in cell wall biosynthesis
MYTIVAIPVYNEARYIAGVVPEVQRYVPEVLVVDDGSTDASPQLLVEVGNLHVIRHERNMGYGQSLLDAFNYAICKNKQWIITMDCDRQHEPASIPDFLAAAATDQYDIISGSRYLRPTVDDSSPPPERRAINAEITEILNQRLHLGLTDAFCGFKAYRVSRLVELKITEPGYAMPLQLWVHAARRGFRIHEIPVRLIYNDPKRSFGGPLDDREFRRQHYLCVLHQALTESLGELTGCYCRSTGSEPCQAVRDVYEQSREEARRE